MKAGGLETDEVALSVAGNGEASVNAKKNLRISIAGHGEVSYTVDATVSSSIAGSGRVTER